MEIRQTTFAELHGQAGAMFEAHWREIALNKQLMALSPDLDAYGALESSGKLFTLCAHEGGSLIGYSVNFIANHIHYSDLLVATNDALYIAPEYRRGGIGIKLIRQTEIAARELGARMMSWHAKENTALCALMARKGYGVQDIIFTKEL